MPPDDPQPDSTSQPDWDAFAAHLLELSDSKPQPGDVDDDCPDDSGTDPADRRG